MKLVDIVPRRLALAAVYGNSVPVSYTHLDVYKRQVHKVFEDRKLLLLAAGNNKLPLLRDNGETVSYTHLYR